MIDDENFIRELAKEDGGVFVCGKSGRIMASKCHFCPPELESCKPYPSDVSSDPGTRRTTAHSMSIAMPESVVFCVASSSRIGTYIVSYQGLTTCINCRESENEAP